MSEERPAQSAPELSIHLEHVRCFKQARSIGIRPLTILLGENSSGKSTFLAVVNAILGSRGFPFSPGFNDPPFNLGTFDTIATYRGGKYGRDDMFSLGLEVNSGREPRRAIAKYNNVHGNPSLHEIDLEEPLGALKLQRTDEYFEGTLRSSRMKGSGKTTKVKVPMAMLSRFRNETLMSQSLFDDGGDEVVETLFNYNETTFLAMRMLSEISGHYLGTVPVAPVRSKPKRTYDEIEGAYNPEGDHVPSLLARLLRQEQESKEGKSVQQALEKFGTESGLFDSVDVKKLGQKITDPFQLRVSGVGPSVNLVDVGYGVSQSLPIVVQSVLSSARQLVLLQQPEVHLHPRAQAALGTFLADFVANRKRRVLVETHSDYLVDRIRQEVAAGLIPANQVSILFFHKPKLETTVHEITLDEEGNIQGAPPEYRQFFMEEEMRHFSRGK